MNGRLYDPVLGRMLSPDNFVQMPDFTQNFNRYSYVLNNPLRYVDPDGEWAVIDDLIAMGVGGLINLGSNLVQGNVHSWGQAGGYFLTGAAAGEATLYGGPLAGGAVLGFGNDLTAQVSQNSWGNINWAQTTMSTFMGTATAYVGGQITSKISPYVSGWISNITNSPVIQQAITESVSNATSGFVLGTGISLLNGNDFQTALGDGGQGALFGGGLGLMNGTISGYKYAKEYGLNPLNGNPKFSSNSQYDFSLDSYGENQTLYRGMTGSEGNKGPIFFTDDPKYAATYSKNGYGVQETTISRGTLFQMRQNGHLQINPNGVHYSNGKYFYGQEYMFNNSVRIQLILNFK